MEGNDAFIYSEKMKSEADEILSDTGLINILTPFGVPHIIGSYAMDLMYNPDIDIVVEADNLRVASINALSALVKKRDFEKIEYGDFIKFPRGNRPNGYILVLRTTRGDVRWEIEIWFLSRATKEENDVSQVRALLTPESKRAILEFKKQISERNISKHTISSADIYRAVLENNIVNFDEFITTQKV